MNVASKNRSLERLVLVLGIAVAIMAGLSTSARANDKNSSDHTAAAMNADSEVINCLDCGTNENEAVISVYDYSLEPIFHGQLEAWNDQELLFRSDLLMQDGNHFIYVVEKL